MKKFSLMLVLMSAMAFTFQSCGSDDSDPEPTPPKPAVTLKAGPGLTSGDVTVEGGTEIKFGATVVNHSVNLKSLTVAKVVGSNTQVLKDSSISGKTLDFTMTAITPTVNGSELYQITVVDKDGSSGVVSFKVTTTVAGGGTVRVLTTALGNKQSPSPSCFSLTTGLGYSFGGNEAKDNAASIDIIYYFNDVNQPCVAAPSNANVQAHYSDATGPISTWTVKNNTDLRISTISTADYNTIVDQGDDAKIITEASAGSYSNELVNVKIGDRFVVRSVNGVNAICEIKTLTGTQSQSGELGLEVKVQEQ